MTSDTPSLQMQVDLMSRMLEAAKTQIETLLGRIDDRDRTILELENNVVALKLKLEALERPKLH